MINRIAITVCSFLGCSLVFAAGWDPNTQASNRDSVANTRHNLTVDYSLPPGPPEEWRKGMGEYVEGYGATKGRWNEYGEVCIYCHTPHGASSTLNGPLWNRAQKGNTQYWRYDTPTMSGQVAETQYGDFPWPALEGRTRRMNEHSMMCLSCHDGTLGMDAVLNMPGSGNYSNVGEFVDGANNVPAVNAFLDNWTNPNGLTSTHDAMVSCWGCHDAGSPLNSSMFANKEFYIAPYVGGSLELRDDHPVAITMPDTSVYDFNTPDGMTTGAIFYDKDGDSRMDKEEIRLYDYGDGKPTVECSSCHDPHGVPSGGAGSEFIPSFLRVSNTQSTLCLTCHMK